MDHVSKQYQGLLGAGPELAPQVCVCKAMAALARREASRRCFLVSGLCGIDPLIVQASVSHYGITFDSAGMLEKIDLWK